jgi:hypothetical protein
MLLWAKVHFPSYASFCFEHLSPAGHLICFPGLLVLSFLCTFVYLDRAMEHWWIRNFKFMLLLLCYIYTTSKVYMFMCISLSFDLFPSPWLVVCSIVCSAITKFILNLTSTKLYMGLWVASNIYKWSGLILLCRYTGRWLISLFNVWQWYFCFI